MQPIVYIRSLNLNQEKWKNILPDRIAVLILTQNNHHQDDSPQGEAGLYERSEEVFG
jgi:hypothetical protein